MSALALSLQLAENGVISSPLSGNNEGSTETSWHTCCSQFAIKSHNSLCWMKVKPPCRQIMAWYMLNEFPHTQWLGILVNCQPYLRKSASLNSCLLKWKPCSWSGRAVSQSKEHLAVVNSMVHWSCGSTQDLMFGRVEVNACYLDWRMVQRACWRQGMWKSSVYCIIIATKLPLSNLKDESWKSLKLVGLRMFNSPNRQGSESRFPPQNWAFGLL